ncbi:MAG: hypothetical protein M5U16_04750 [Hyphomicrobium sp.]|nr:hypothetical protein [Hyphomicrobium sp.]
MAKKITLNDIAMMLSKQSIILAKHGKEISDLTASVAYVVKHMATKDDIAMSKRTSRARRSK